MSHPTAIELGRRFFELYGAGAVAPYILEIGSQSASGGIRSVAPAGAFYTGVDLEPGTGVDIVVKGGQLPFNDGTFDLVVSSSVLEHDPQFWMTVLEAFRVTKAGGFVYFNAPSGGQYHAYPIDAWRFYPDAGLALEAWGRQMHHHVHLIESFQWHEDPLGSWRDAVMVFGRETSGRAIPEGRLSHDPRARHVRGMP